MSITEVEGIQAELIKTLEQKIEMLQKEISSKQNEIFFWKEKFRLIESHFESLIDKLIEKI